MPINCTTRMFWMCECPSDQGRNLHARSEPRCSWCLQRQDRSDAKINDVLLYRNDLTPQERGMLIAERDGCVAARVPTKEPEKEPFRFLNGDDYPHLCDVCRSTISAVVASLFDGDQEDTDDPEAPINYVYDHKMYCGGYECVNKPRQPKGRNVCEECGLHIVDCRCHFRIGPVTGCECAECQQIVTLGLNRLVGK